MAAIQTECLRLEQRSVIEFLVTEKFKKYKIYIKSIYLGEISKPTVIEGDPKAPFSITTTTPKCKEGSYVNCSTYP